jgi:radical SAM superfamily enzyme YgiQ (UPF0313 family)
MDHNVYLINVSRKTNQIQFPIGLSVIANSLKLHNIEPKVVDLIPVAEENREEFFKSKLHKGPDIFGFSIVAGNNHLDEVEKYAKIVLDSNQNNIIIYGGPLPSAIPEMLLNKCSCDYIITGEGEFSFPKLIKSIRKGERYPKDIQGLFFKKEGKIFGERRKRIIELGRHSKMNYDLFDMDFYINYLKKTGQSFEMMATRGCRGNCSFCYKFCGNGLSMTNVDLLLDEIEEIISRFDMRRIYFVDENFLDSKKYFLEFVRKKRERGMDFTFIGQARLDSVDEEICRIGKENGLICISSGIESYSQETLNKINKGMKIKDVEEKIKQIRKYDILLLVSFIVGFEWDTEKDYEELKKFIKKNKLEKKSKIHYLTPLPKTRIYKRAVEKGLIKDEYEYIRNLGDLYWERMINMTSLPDEVLDYYYQKLYKMCSKDVVYPESEEYLRQIRKIH